MKKLFKLFSFLLVLVLSFLIVINTHAEGKNGFIEENGNTYYYENGELQKGIKEIESLKARGIKAIIKERIKKRLNIKEDNV